MYKAAFCIGAKMGKYEIAMCVRGCLFDTALSLVSHERRDYLLKVMIFEGMWVWLIKEGKGVFFVVWVKPFYESAILLRIMSMECCYVLVFGQYLLVKGNVGHTMKKRSRIKVTFNWLIIILLKIVSLGGCYVLVFGCFCHVLSWSFIHGGEL